MSKLNLAVVFGGYSTEHEVSLASAANIINNISNEKYNIIPVYISPKGSWFMYEGSIDSFKSINWEKFGTPCQFSLDMNDKGLIRFSGSKFKKIPVDVVFPVLHGKYGEDGTIQGLLEMAGLPYVGCGVLASSLAMDKATTKIIAENLGIKQAKHLYFNRYTVDIETAAKQVRYKIGYPCFVKPSRAGSSLGVSKVQNKKELLKAMDLAFSHDEKILVEKCVKGKELECSVLGSLKSGIAYSAVGEIKAGAEFYDYDAKYNNAQSETIIPADIDEETAKKIGEASVKIFEAIYANGMSRVDFFLEDETGNVIFNEINTIPGFTDISMYPKLIENMGITQGELIDRLIEIALETTEG